MAKDLSSNLAPRVGEALGRIVVVALRIEAFGIRGLAKLGLPRIVVGAIKLALRSLILVGLLAGGFYAAAFLLITVIALSVVYIVAGGVDKSPAGTIPLSTFANSAFEPIQDSASFDVSGVSRNGHDGYGLYDQFNNRIDNR